MLDNQPSTVVGVLAPEIEIGNLSEIDVWVPLTLQATAAREERTLRVTGRLRPGATVAQASADASRYAQALAREYPNVNEGWSARVAPTREAMTGTDTWAIMTLLALVVGFVLLPRARTSRIWCCRVHRDAGGSWRCARRSARAAAASSGRC